MYFIYCIYIYIIYINMYIDIYICAKAICKSNHQPLLSWSGRHTTSMVHMSADEHQEAAGARSTRTDGYLLDLSQIMMRNLCSYAEHAWSVMHSKFSPQDFLARHVDRTQ